MGIIRRGILGGFSNRVGNVVGSSWKGIATMRVLPLSVANPRTAAQINVRKNFSGITKMASELLTSIVKPLNDRFAVRMSGYNLFIQRNSKAFKDDGTFDYKEFTLSHGRLSAPVIKNVDVNKTATTVDFDSTASGSMDLPTDLVYAVVIEESSSEIIGVSSGIATRGSGKVVINTIGDPEEVVLYMSFLRADGTEVSPSSFVVS